MTIIQKAEQARERFLGLSDVTADKKNMVLEAVARELEKRKNQIQDENKKDLVAAEEQGIGDVLIKRLKLSDAKFAEIIANVRSVAALADPVGRVQMTRELDVDLILEQITVPIGVIGVIFESRPDALVQISSLSLKSGNGVVLKGGSEALLTNRALFAAFEAAFEETAPEFKGLLQLVETREDIAELLKLDEYIDLMIPRGSNALVKYIKENTKIPVMGHADGICHVYLDKDAETAKAVPLTVDSKTQYPAVCNAVETLLVHKDRAAELLPLIQKAMPQVELRGDDATCTIIDAARASAEDWDTEYNDLILSVRVVESLDQAVEHINRHGSGHTEMIVTENNEQASRFMSRIDASSVMQNASTRFADGFRYGFGAEVGISTNKLHARGPVGLDGLVTYKYRLTGKGQIVADYAEGRSRFTHRDVK